MRGVKCVYAADAEKYVTIDYLYQSMPNICTTRVTFELRKEIFSLALGRMLNKTCMIYIKCLI